MDDSCAVCADALEWAAYGACGHREVCSTCVARLRFVLDDRRCCICKTDNPSVFVTKAMGDYTRVITDFSLFPANATEGKVGEFWYHESTQAYFDDGDHYRMTRAMCKLSCSVCDKNAEEQGAEATRRRSRFKNIEQLKGHLYHQHRLFMCSLCLEGRKVFICEQKLYTRSQLNQHISTGDSEVDGSESERGGFMGHPMCEFCKNPFYGDNELYTHMSTEHYTCHICQRQHPGQYDYFRNYDDLESHFRQEHFLCEDEACLSKKFIVFQTEAEMKRHNAIEHGGHMSRSKRNAVLQIPTSFRYRRSNEQEQRRGRGRGSRHDPSGNELAAAIQASLEPAVADGRAREQTSELRPFGQNETNQSDSGLGTSETLSISSSSASAHAQTSRNPPSLEEISFPIADRQPPELSSRYAQALIQNSGSAARLGQESFPPLPGVESSSKQKAENGPGGLGHNTLAARLQQRNKVKVLNTARHRLTENYKSGEASSTSLSQMRGTPSHGLVPSSSASSQAWATAQVVLPSSSAIPQGRPMRENGFATPLSSTPAWNINNGSRMKHSSSAPNLVEGRPKDQAFATSSQSLPKVEDVQTENKSLVERIRASLGMDEDKFAAFKSISAEYRQNIINTWEYLSYVEQFGLSHLILELARLCPDSQKQQELINAYNANVRAKGQAGNGGSNAPNPDENKPVKKGQGSREKGKGKEEMVVNPTESVSAKDALADDFMTSVRKLQLNRRPQDQEEVEVLLKDGYRSAKGKLEQLTGGASGNSESLNNSNSSNHNPDGRGSSKQRRKTSKFHRVRLGDGSVAALFDLGRQEVSPERGGESRDKPTEGLPVRGVWRKGGGLKLVASQKDPSK